MDRSFILKNQDGHYWGRSKEWVDGSDRSRVAQYKHRDEASNTVFELSSKDFGLRAEIMEMTLKEGKLPKLNISQIPLPGLEEEREEENEETVDENDAGANKSINDDAVPGDSSDEEKEPESTDQVDEESNGETPDEHQ